MKINSTLAGLAFVALLTSTSALAQSVVRGPYLQMQTSDGISIHWRTDSSTDSVVRYGLTPGNLDTTITVSGSRTEHSVDLSGLATAQTYYYSVGDSLGALAGDASYHFQTAPLSGTPADTRIWVIGDSGTANSNARNVRDAFKSWSASDPADFWIMLGDNAYNNGTDPEYQAAVFNIYPELLRQLPVWSTLGNHDGYSASSAAQSGPYYDIFQLPTNAEVGGWPSGTEAYYSFDYANIHFVCLDSYDSDRSVNSTMLQWLEADLMQNTQPWLIAFWHHPPYTKGSHNSDSEGALIDMRQNALPILEAWGVDLVLTGHSHTYERSILLDGHYGSSGTFNGAVHAIDPGDGSETGDGAYEKPDIIAAENAGAVYAVAGSSGKVSTGYALDHPAMIVALESLGSMVLDVSGNRMDVVFLNQGGSTLDNFTLIKTPDSDPPLITGATAPDANHVEVAFDEPLNSSQALDIGNYGIAGLSISQAELLAGDRTVRLTVSTMTNGASYTLTVNDLQDQAGNTIAANSTVNFDYFDIVTVAFQDGLAPTPAYDGTRDGYIREASATTMYGLETTLQVDGDEPSGTGTDMNILLSWDISSIPVTATVVDAHFELEVTNTSSGIYNCNGLLRAWTESQATWNLAASGNAWGTPGAESASDRDTEVLCAISAGSTGSLNVQFTQAGLDWLQEWISNPASNHGLIISHPSTSDGADFHSRESATAMARPRLEVTYSLPVTPPNIDPVANFSHSCIDLDCSFTDTSSDSDGSVVAWSWDFGDGNSSSAQNPDHSYAAAGSYTVKLTVTDDQGGSDNTSKLISVTAANMNPTADFLHSCTDLDCSFTDTSSDSDGNIVAWSWDFGDGGSSSAQNPNHSYSSAGDYTVSLTVTDNGGLTDSTSNLVTAAEPPSSVDQFAIADLPSAGTVNGSYADTHGDDEITQTIRERESGGKKNSRYSYLEHTWQFSVAAGSMVTVYANAWSGGSSDGDAFRFAWSNSSNGNFTTLFTVSSMSPGNMQSAVIPSSGTIYVRVEDTNHAAGNRNLDTVFIDQLFIRTDNATPAEPPLAPTNLSVSGVTSSSISLSWDHPSEDETSFDLERSTDGSNWTSAGSPAGGSNSQTNGGLSPLTQYYYRIRARNSAGVSDWSNTVNAITSAAPAINLSASGYKVRGIHHVDLSWSGASGGSVDIMRDGSFLTTTPNDGAYTDNTNNKGGQTYVYSVCNTGTSTCSSDVVVVF